MKVANISSLNVCNQLPLRLPNKHAQKHVHSHKAYFYDSAGSISLVVLNIKAANTSKKDNDIPNSIDLN